MLSMGKSPLKWVTLTIQQFEMILAMDKNFVLSYSIEC
jgi:hypothetical protein